MIPETTYLVGTQYSFQRYCREAGISQSDPWVECVDSMELLRNVHSGHIVFLKDWEVLKDHRQMYNYVIGKRTALRLARENGSPR